MKKKSKKSTAKRLLEFEDRWAPDNVSLASIKTSIPTQTMVTVPKLSKKKRNWTIWAVYKSGDPFVAAWERSDATALKRELQRLTEFIKGPSRYALKKVKVTEV